MMCLSHDILTLKNSSSRFHIVISIHNNKNCLKDKFYGFSAGQKEINEKKKKLKTKKRLTKCGNIRFTGLQPLIESRNICVYVDSILKNIRGYRLIKSRCYTY